MNAKDMPRFGVALCWLAGKYPLGHDRTTGKPIPRPLPGKGDLKEYFEALADLSIEAVERGVRWHYGHSEFWPHQPAALRKSIEASPKPRVEAPAVPSVSREALPDVPPETRKARLQQVFDQCNRMFGTKLKA